MDVDNQTFMPGRHKLPPGEVLEPDESTYELLHRLEPPWPCLSFDIIRDNLGDGKARKMYPATVYAVAGTQAAQGHEKENELLVMKMSKLSRTQRLEDDESSDDEDESDEETDPVLETKKIRLNTCTNRIRAHQLAQNDPLKPSTTLTATMTESGSVFIHDITPHLTSFDTPGTIITPQQNQPLHTIKAHRSVEGYALDWAPASTQPPKLLTGDSSGKIFCTTINPSGTSTTDTRPFAGHSGSVEELQWSPSEANVFASGSSDGTVKVWDLRSKAHKPALSVIASKSDINVLSWSRLTTHLLASGADDGQWAVWDLRNWRPAAGGAAASSTPSPVAAFDFHKEQITSVEWHPTDDSIVAVAAGDNTLTLWDLAVELDDEESRYTADVQGVPPQLLFVHYMEQVKECHWHPQMPGVLMATGGSGFGYAMLSVYCRILLLTLTRLVYSKPSVSDTLESSHDYVNESRQPTSELQTWLAWYTRRLFRPI